MRLRVAKHSYIGRIFQEAGSRFQDTFSELEARALLGEGSASYTGLWAMRRGGFF